MKLSIPLLTISPYLCGLAILVAPAVHAQQVVNLNDYDNFAAQYNFNQYNPYVGPGAYPGSTPGDFWNGFGLESNGNNPYPASGLLSDSTGTPTAMTYSINYDGNNGGLTFGGSYQGTPGFLFGEAALVSGTDVGTLTLHNVASTTFNLYLYGANFDGSRGAQFTVNSGVALDGLSATTNPNFSGGSGPLTSFILGGDYVEFTGVTPDSSGNITITWTQNTADHQGGGEGDFNGLSLVTAPVPEPSCLALAGVALSGLLFMRRKGC